MARRPGWAIASSTSFTLLAGVLIGLVGGANVLAVDSATYFLFVGILARLGVPRDHSRDRSGSGLVPVFRFLRRQPAVTAITLMFMAFNVGEGMLLVVLPVMARRELGGDAATYGLLLSSFAVATTAGSFVAGAISWRWTLGRSIARRPRWLPASRSARSRSPRGWPRRSRSW
jgi:hypothetical protein